MAAVAGYGDSLDMGLDVCVHLILPGRIQQVIQLFFWDKVPGSILLRQKGVAGAVPAQFGRSGGFGSLSGSGENRVKQKHGREYLFILRNHFIRTPP